MNFIIGLIVSALLIGSVGSEISGSFRSAYSVIFLGGIFGITFILYKSGILLTPMFLGGFLVNVIFFAIVLPFVLTEYSKDKKEEKTDGRRN